MRARPILALALFALLPLAGAAAPEPVREFVLALEDVEHAYEEGAYVRVDEELLPALQAKWQQARPILAAEHAHEAEEIDEALDALATKIGERAPVDDVLAIVGLIEHEVAEATDSLAPVTDHAAASAAFRAKIDEVASLYAAGQPDAAITAVREAYLDIYGPSLEARVKSIDRHANDEIESLLNVKLVAAIKAGAPEADVRALVTDIHQQLDVVDAKAAEGRSAASMLFNSFLILVREGFEAMLVIGALAMYLTRTGHKAKAPLLYWGAAAGVAASFVLWFVVRAFVGKLPIDREIIEGASALLAVVVLFYVSYWLISKVEAGRWNRFVQGKMKGALAAGSGLTLVGIAFLAVFREGFETVIFYQGLYAGSGAESHGVAVTAGLVAGAIALAAAALAFYRFGVKLPLRPFFIGTSILLYYLAFAFTGAGIHELQEAAVVSTTFVPAVDGALALPILGTLGDLLGIHPTVETLVAQGFLMIMVGLGLAWTFIIEPRRDRVATPDV